MVKKIRKKRNWSRRAKDKGYRVENQCVHDFKNKGYFALRIPTALQVNELSKVDVIYFKGEHGGFVQCKYTRENMSARDKELLAYTANKYGSHAELCYRKSKKLNVKRGIHYELIPFIENTTH